MSVSGNAQASPPPQAPASVDLRFHSRWEFIDDSREFLLRALGRVISDRALLSRIGIAAHELMENAFKYSPLSEVAIRIDIDPRGEVRVTVENVGLPANVAELIEIVGVLKDIADPLAHYRQKMEQSVGSAGSGLGLARVRWEAGMTVKCDVDGERVRVTACGPCT